MNVTILPIIASAIAAFIIGMIWYGYLFSKLWVEGHGFTPEQVAGFKDTAPRAGAVSFVGYLVTAYILSLLFSYMKITDVQTALRVTFLIWLGFPAMIGLMNTMYSDRSLVVYLIDVGYQLAYLLVAAVLLTIWR